MAYRVIDNPPKPEDMLLMFPVRNGAIARIAFGCYYLGNGHDPHYHDHKHWPTWDYHPGSICQMPPPRNRFRWLRHGVIVDMERIHLIEEGYDQATVSYEDNTIAQHLSTKAWIDESDDYIVRMNIGANLDTFSDKPIDIRFTVFVSKSDGSARDAVCHGILTVLPGGAFATE